MKNLFYFIFLLSHTLYAQPAIQWQKVYGGNQNDVLISIKQINDKGYILAGVSKSGISGNKTETNRGLEDYWIVKIDSLGTIDWQKTIGGNKEDYLFAFETTNDGGYICGGRSDSDISGEKTDSCRGVTDYWIVKLDSIGSIEWQKTIGGNDQEDFSDVLQTFDGGFLISGYSHTQIASGDKTMDSTGLWVLKLNSLGNILWQKLYVNVASNEIIQLPDSGFMIGGNKGVDYWIAKTDINGNIQWQKTYGGNFQDELEVIKPTVDNGFLLGGSSNSGISGEKTDSCRGFFDFWIIKIDAIGTIQWQKTIGGENHDILTSILETNSGGFVIGGYSSSNISGEKSESCRGLNDYWIVRLDNNGNLLWDKTIGGNSVDELSCISYTQDNGFLLGGYSSSDIANEKTESCFGLWDYWILKYSTDNTSIEEPNNNNIVSIFPIPTSKYLNVEISSDEQYELRLYNSLGEQIFQSKFVKNITINIEIFNDGIYYAGITNRMQKTFYKKFLVVKH